MIIAIFGLLKAYFHPYFEIFLNTMNTVQSLLESEVLTTIKIFNSRHDSKTASLCDQQTMVRSKPI